jgi:SAM-dependent methyltransferase
VFDFGCGCGRLARQLLQQTPRPRRYVGVDAHPGMVAWCKQHLSAVDPAFQFFHHDVYAPHTPENTLRLAEPFPVGDEEFSLFIAHSVFTHLVRPQAEYYLAELARILRPGGVAFTSWFFFDRMSFSFYSDGPYTLYLSETNPNDVAIYDRGWFLDTVRRLGLGVRRTDMPGSPGHQWPVYLEKRTAQTEDHFPLGEDGSEWLCGATYRPAAKATIPQETLAKHQLSVGAESPAALHGPPPLSGPLAELAKVKAELAASRPGLRPLSSLLAEMTALKAELAAREAELTALRGRR